MFFSPTIKEYDYEILKKLGLGRTAHYFKKIIQGSSERLIPYFIYEKIIPIFSEIFVSAVPWDGRRISKIASKHKKDPLLEPYITVATRVLKSTTTIEDFQRFYKLTPPNFFESADDIGRYQYLPLPETLDDEMQDCLISDECKPPIILPITLEEVRAAAANRDGLSAVDYPFPG